jgi:hypothetical protein
MPRALHSTAFPIHRTQSAYNFMSVTENELAALKLLTDSLWRVRLRNLRLCSLLLCLYLRMLTDRDDLGSVICSEDPVIL